tara:strand:- start:2376 stop:2735 length:360 start_codon:yes stop_codon:yes gene_type:complete
VPGRRGAASLRGENDGLADELALGVLGDRNSVVAGARSAANESALGWCSPATMADVGKLDLAVIGVGGRASKHTETLLEGRGLSAGNVVDIKTAVVDELSLWTSISDLRNTTGLMLATD